MTETTAPDAWSRSVTTGIRRMFPLKYGIPMVRPGDLTAGPGPPRGVDGVVKAGQLDTAAWPVGLGARGDHGTRKKSIAR
jgi:hypothetical protein